MLWIHALVAAESKPGDASFGVCAIALFVFGFGKYWVLNGRNRRNVNTSLWEGGQIVVLGSVAALAAVLYVRPFDGKLLH